MTQTEPDIARPRAPCLHFPLAGTLQEAGGADALTVQGPHRFHRIGSTVGYQPLSLKTVCRLPTDLHLRNEGTISLWVSPLETLAVAAPMWGFTSRDPHAQEYGLLADTFPNNDPEPSVFAWYWRSVWHPQMIAKFKNGAAGGGHADFAVTPYVPVEHLPLREQQWYHLVFAWNKAESRMLLFVNGIRCGATVYPFRADVPRPELFLGNTAMVFAHLRLFDVALTDAEVAAAWRQGGLPANPAVNRELAALHVAGPKPRAAWRPDPRWTLEMDNPLTEAGSFTDWTQQGCLEPGYALRELKHTSEGLVIETPDQIAIESRVYFWSPKIFEGDLAVAFDFRPERETGLALLVVQASGMQREDFLSDHPPRTTGSMNTIINDRIRNYHWEFFRHSVDVRGDVDTQVLVKNPWFRPLALSSRPLPACGAWSQLLFLQEGDHLRAAINGEWLLDVHDSPTDNHGPVLNTGRIGIRLMYQTRMCFRNLKVWSRARDGKNVTHG